MECIWKNAVCFSERFAFMSENLQFLQKLLNLFLFFENFKSNFLKIVKRQGCVPTEITIQIQIRSEEI